MSFDTKAVKYKKEYVHTKAKDKENDVLQSGKCLGLRYEIDSVHSQTHLTYDHSADLSEPNEITYSC